MFKKAIDKIYQKPLLELTMIFAKPGDGRMNFGIELANTLAVNHKKVCYCNIRKRKTHLQKKLLQSIEIINGLGTTDEYDYDYFLRRLKESTSTRNTVILIDNFSDIVTIYRRNLMRSGAKNICDEYEIQAKLLKYLREITRQKNSNIIITDTLDPKTPFNETFLDLCDDVYLLYKDNTNETYDDPNWYKLKLKSVNKEIL